MTTIFDDAPKYPGLSGDNVRVTHNEDRVLIRAVDIVAEEGVTIAMAPAQARALAQGIIAAAEKAEAGGMRARITADCVAEANALVDGLDGFTPGPWVAEPQVGRGAWVAGENGKWAALSCGDTDVEAEDNARLIAAAPDMHRTIRDLLAVVEKQTLTDAVRDVVAERSRQVSAEEFDFDHDDCHESGEMAQAAACYAISGTPADEAVFIHGRWKDSRDLFWPHRWSRDWWKPGPTRRRDLVKAGALILAEIERLDRAALGEKP